MPTRWHVPTEKPSDVIVEGLVGTIRTNDEYSGSVDVRITRKWLGWEKPEVVQLFWDVSGRGMCAPPGPVPKERQRLLVHLKKQGGKLWPIGWTIIEKEPDGAAIRRQNEEAARRLPLSLQSTHSRGAPSA